MREMFVLIIMSNSSHEIVFNVMFFLNTKYIICLSEWGIVWFLECEMDLVAQLLSARRQYQNGKCNTPQQVTPLATLEPRLYRVFFPRASGSIGFPVGVCQGQVTTHTNLRIRSVHRHVQDRVVIMEEGNRPHPCFLSSDIFVPWQALNPLHHLYFSFLVPVTVTRQHTNYWVVFPSPEHRLPSHQTLSLISQCVTVPVH